MSAKPGAAQNFLAPEIIEAIISGTQPAALDAKTLLNLSDLPLDWTAQWSIQLMQAALRRRFSLQAAARARNAMWYL